MHAAVRLPKKLGQANSCLRNHNKNMDAVHSENFLCNVQDTVILVYAMLGALDAILGHRSAHSLATGPVTVEPAVTIINETITFQMEHTSPFISPFAFTITPALSVMHITES